MAQAGPSKPINLKKNKKSALKNEVRSSKVKKVTEIKSIEALEEAVMNYVSKTSVLGSLFIVNSLTQRM